VTYWNTACLEPEIEAVSKELLALSTHFCGRLFGVSPHYLLRYSAQRRSIGFHPGFDPLLRLLIPLLEMNCDISHVYGEPSPWIFHKTLRRKPIVLTVASEKGGLVNGFLARCRRIITQTEGFRQTLIDAGVRSDRVEVIYPGVDLESYIPATSAPDLSRPQVLFATAPRSEAELAPRGVPLLLDCAEAAAHADFSLCYRRWASGYTSLGPTKAMMDDRNLANVNLTDSVVADMGALYRRHHFTVIPFTTPDGGKECPNSLLEGLACGVPVLISSVAPFAEFVQRHDCGEVFDPEPRSFRAALDRGAQRWHTLSAQARTCAEHYFSAKRALGRYGEIYAQCLDENPAHTTDAKD